MTRLALAALGLLALGACREDALPPPVAMTSDALGFYCQMNLTEHPGPKAQIHLTGLAAPLFFAQVRDAIAYQRMPEQSHAIAVVYVSDMGAAPGWDAPGPANWIDATDAVFVIGSDAVGGMGAVEVVPFSDRDAALGFAAQHGGRVGRLAEIDDADVLAPQDDTPAAGTDDGNEDYRDRLKALTGERQG